MSTINNSNKISTTALYVFLSDSDLPCSGKIHSQLTNPHLEHEWANHFPRERLDPRENDEGDRKNIKMFERETKNYTFAELEGPSNVIEMNKTDLIVPAFN